MLYGEKSESLKVRKVRRTGTDVPVFSDFPHFSAVPVFPTSGLPDFGLFRLARLPSLSPAHLL